MIESFAGSEFNVTSVSSIADNSESIEFVAEGGPNVAISVRDDDPSQVIYISVEGEVEEAVLLRMIAYSRKRLGVAALAGESQ